jgi:hypothetical protein
MASTISAGTTSGTAIAITGDTTGALALLTNNGTTAVTIDTSQNVGIGTSSPTDNLYISRATNAAGGISVVNTNNAQASQIAQLYLQGGDNAYAQIKLQANSVNSSIRGNSDGSLAFLSSTTERMRINSSGFVGVNCTTQPALGVEIFGVLGGTGAAIGAATNSASNPTIFAANTSAGTVQIFRLSTGASGSTVGTITGNGTNAAYNTSSDYRLKENIAPMTGALATVAQLKPVTYKWKSTGEDGQGFIAHELQAIVPDCVTGEKDAVETVDIKDEEGKVIGQEEKPVYQGIDTSFLVATLTAAIQELNAKVDAQALEIQALKATPLPAENT